MEKLFLGLTFLAIGFALIVSPLLAILCLMDGFEQPFVSLVMALICMVIDIIIVACWITGRKMNDTNRERMKKIRTAVNVITMFVAICLLPGVWSVSEEGQAAKRKEEYKEYLSTRRTSNSNKTTERSSNSTSAYTSSSKSTNTCVYTGCERKRYKGSYCIYHACTDSECDLGRYEESLYCFAHQKKASSGNTKGSYTNGVEDYDNPDDYASDFAEDYAYDEFGDDTSWYAYEYGYEEAYDHWMDEMEE